MTVPVPTLRIGVHKGKKFNQVHPDYLRGLLKLPGLWAETRAQIEFYLKPVKWKDAKAAQPKQGTLKHNPQYFEKGPPPPERTESGKNRFRQLSQQAKEKAGYV